MFVLYHPTTHKLSYAFESKDAAEIYVALLHHRGIHDIYDTTFLAELDVYVVDEDVSDLTYHPITPAPCSFAGLDMFELMKYARPFVDPIKKIRHEDVDMIITNIHKFEFDYSKLEIMSTDLYDESFLVHVILCNDGNVHLSATLSEAYETINLQRHNIQSAFSVKTLTYDMSTKKIHIHKKDTLFHYFVTPDEKQLIPQYGRNCKKDAGKVLCIKMDERKTTVTISTRAIDPMKDSKKRSLTGLNTHMLKHVKL